MEGLVCLGEHIFSGYTMPNTCINSQKAALVAAQSVRAATAHMLWVYTTDVNAA